MPVAGSRVQIRTVRDGDLEPIAALLQDGFPYVSARTWTKRFGMWWLQNPAQQPDIPFGWVLEDPSRGIVGFFGNIPVKFLVQGKPGLACASTSWFVREGARSHSLALIYEHMRQKQGNLLLTTRPNKQVQSILPRLGYTALNFPPNNREYWYVRDYQKYFAELARYRLQKHPSIAASVSAGTILIKPFSSGIKSWKDRSRNPVPAGPYCCQRLQKGGSLAELWEKNRPAHGTTLFRDAATLDWLFFSDLVAGKRFVLGCRNEDTGSTEGYLVLDRVRLFSQDSILLRMMDCSIPSRSSEVLEALFRHALVIARTINADAVRFWSPGPEADRVLEQLCPIQRSVTYPYYYKFINGAQVPPPEGEDTFVPSYIDPNGGTL